MDQSAQEDSECRLHSIRSLLDSSTSYEIPLYQRGYTWGREELKQLIQDVWDNAQQEKVRNYYLGTLVVVKRCEAFSGQESFEVVDGQQRLITLHILYCALKLQLSSLQELFDGQDLLNWYKGHNLKFAYREKSQNTLEILWDLVDRGMQKDSQESQATQDKAISDNFDEVLDAFAEVTGIRLAQSMSELDDKCRETLKNNTKRFLAALNDHAYLARVQLPASVDLNHYFEVMNSRGVQLEKHEILKARILDELIKEQEDTVKPLYSRLARLIWDACADMGHYVQMGFKPNLRDKIFSKNWDNLTCKSFRELFDICRNDLGNLPSTEQEQAFSLNDLIKGQARLDANSVPDDESANKDRFFSVINFPNFLLQVLRVMTKRDDAALDDKRLLEIFGPQLSGDFAGRFLFELLKMRWLFDKYVIKRDLGNAQELGEWKLPNTQGKDEQRTATVEYSKDPSRMIMAQLMFHVSSPSQNYKHWLTGVLKHTAENWDAGKNPDADLENYLDELSKAYIADRFLAPSDQEKRGYYDIIFGKKSCSRLPENFSFPSYLEGVDFFIFNFLDYRLWLNASRASSADAAEKKFSFTVRSSIEHFYPQHPIDGQELLDDKSLHRFGNLCLISRSKNSKYSNYSPIAKCEQYTKDVIDSLKQHEMMKIVSAKHSWQKEDIEEHEEKMRQVILEAFKDQGQRS